MIAKIAIPIIIAIVLATFYFDRSHWRRCRWWWRLLGWVPAAGVVGLTVFMARQPDYFPDNIEWQNQYLNMLMFFVVPVVLSAIGGLVGHRWKKRLLGEVVGLALSQLVVLAYSYGTFAGFEKVEVRRIELSFADLPPAFDGYRIVQFSDAHVGTYVGRRADILRRAVDSINAQQADMVVFTGDLQNKRPEEVEPHKSLLASIKARDGVFSVLGNHDYCEYIDSKDPYVLSRQMGLSVGVHQEMGWQLLTNSRQRIRRDSSSIVIAGMENDGEGRFPQLGDISSTLNGVSRKEFVIMLEHDPTSWRRKILPHCHAQLTLSGHTHGGQMALFGWSPAALRYSEYDGLYHAGDRQLFVSRGLGGVVPFRLGASGEIVVITLKRKN